MELSKHMAASGEWLFRWRGILPVVLFVPLGFAVADYHWPLERHDLQEILEATCFAVSLAGVFVRVLVAGCVPRGTSGRNLSTLRADTLNTTGMYSLCRHPLYLGNCLIGLGWSLFFFNGWFLAFYVTTFWLYYERIMFAEEAFLKRKYDQQFDMWAEGTNAFFPKLTGLRSPKLTFCWRTALRREYLTFTGVVVLFVLFECVEHLRVEGTVPFEPYWGALLAVTLVAFACVRLLAKRSSVLHRPGR